MSVIYKDRVKVAFEGDINKFLDPDAEQNFPASYYGYLYLGETAFQLCRTMDDDRLLDITVQLTQTDLDAKTYPEEDILYLDTVNGVNAVAQTGIINITDKDIEGVRTEEELADRLITRISGYYPGVPDYNDRYKMSIPTVEFYK